MSTKTNGELRCIEVVELASDYLDRSLSAAETARLEQHLSGCDGCSAYVEQMRTTIAGLRRLGKPGAPAGFDGLLAAFRAHRARGV